ncbi:MAG TPA: heavy metal-associated domain-containing protein [Myxococcaceae bacterium]|nr:heavy metal-associated domain-containing protein [Myxococcaceae bacterium]
MITSEFRVTGMSCGHCEGAVRREVEKLPGVTAIEVSAKQGALTITSADPLEEAQVLSAVEEAGFEAAPVR